MSDVNIYTFEADGIPGSYVDLDDYTTLKSENAKLFNALVLLYKHEGTTVDTGIGPMEPDELQEARALAAGAIAAARQEGEGLDVVGYATASELEPLLDELKAERDTLRQQLAEARDEISQHSNDLALTYMKGGADMRQQRDKLVGLLREAKQQELDFGLWQRINAALAEVTSKNKV